MLCLELPHDLALAHGRFSRQGNLTAIEQPRVRRSSNNICFWTGERIRPTPLKIDPTRPRSLNRILEQNGRGTMGTYTRALRLFPTRGGHVRLMQTIYICPQLS
jgi:hypothetical protein